MGDYSWEYYEENHGKDATADYKKVVDALADVVKDQKWNLTQNFTKQYIGFKLGNIIVFSINWDNQQKWRIHLKIPEEASKNYKGQNWEFQVYDKSFKEAIFKTRSRHSEDIEELKDLLILAYKNVSGTNK
jgi:hypothetical protein